MIASSTHLTRTAMERSLRRIVTGHNSVGLAIVQRDDLLQTQPIPTGEAYFARLWTTATSPASNIGSDDAALLPTGLTCPGGSVLRLVDIPPGSSSPMHRTHSVDYGILLAGQLEMELDGGARVTLRPGDIVVQRGTNHRWINCDAQIARMIFVLVAAQPIVHDGQPLPETH
jgi:quercetin dioxygenase-like cupin family protein